MQNNHPHHVLTFRNPGLTSLSSVPITSSYSRDFIARGLYSKRTCRLTSACFLCVAVFLGTFSNLSSLKAEPQTLPIAHQKNDFSTSSKEIPVYHFSSFTKDKQKAQTSNYSSDQLSFFQKRAEGWHWYQSLSESLNDNKIEESKTEEEKKGYGLASSSAQTPTEKIEVQRKQLETKLHAALLEPNRKNIITYILAQKALMDQSQRFSEAWQQVVMTTPSLDETLIYPVNQNARHIYYDEQRRKISEKIQGLAQEYGLFFFFRQNCPYCHHFAPIVRRFAEKHGWSVLGISLDGGTLSDFPNAKRDNGIAERLGITHIPALIALHPQTGKLIPLAYGMVSENEIEQRIELLTSLSQVKPEVKK